MKSREGGKGVEAHLHQLASLTSKKKSPRWTILGIVESVFHT